jgi:hypothetical protein
MLQGIPLMMTSRVAPPVPNTGTTHGTVNWVADVPSNYSGNTYSLDLDGVSGYISTTTDVSFDESASTLSIFFKADAFGGMIIGHSADNNAYVYLVNSTTINVQSTAGTAQSFTIAAMSTGTWYNLIITRSSMSTRVYINNVESSSGALSIGNTMPIDQVGRYESGLFAGFFFDGKVAEWRMFRSVLSSGDRAAIVAGTAISTSSYLHWKINEGSGTNITDYMI